jgi:hypothetical protein
MIYVFVLVLLRQLIVLQCAGLLERMGDETRMRNFSSYLRDLKDMGG